MDFICFAVFSFRLDSNMPLCYSAIPSRSLRRDGADLKGFGISQQAFCNAKIADVYTSALLATIVLVLRSSQPVNDTDTQTYAKIEMCWENDMLLAGYVSFSSHRRKTLHILTPYSPSHLSANAFKSPIWFTRCHSIVELARIFYFASLYTTHGLRGWVTWTTSP